MLLSDYINQTRELVHDTSSIDYTDAEMTAYVNDARNQIADDFWCVRTYFTNLSTIVGQEIYPMTSGVGGATVTVGGVYSSTPTVTFSAPPAGGVTATGVAIMGGTGSSQFVQQIGMTSWGSGYTQATVPTVTFGSGAAAATANALLNVYDIYTISAIFGTQRLMLLWASFAAFNAWFRSDLTRSGRPLLWSGYNSQNRFHLYPLLPDNTYVLEIDAYVRPFPLVNLTDVDMQVTPPMNDIVQYWAAYKALFKAQNFQQADYCQKQYEGQAKKKGASRFAPRRPNIYNNTVRRIQRGYS